jgi:hypothetical protein
MHARLWQCLGHQCASSRGAVGITKQHARQAITGITPHYVMLVTQASSPVVILRDMQMTCVKGDGHE